jgi:hypothetical protein
MFCSRGLRHKNRTKYEMFTIPLKKTDRRYPRTMINEISSPSGGCFNQIKKIVSRKQILHINATRDKNFTICMVGLDLARIQRSYLVLLCRNCSRFTTFSLLP